MSRFATVTTRLSATFSRPGAVPNANDYERVRAQLPRILLVRYRSLGADAVLEVVDEAIARLLQKSREQGRALDNAGGWLVTVAMNLARDRLRRADPTMALAEQPAADDDVARMIDRDAKRDTLQRAIAEAIRHSDHAGVQVVTTWLDLASETGEAPSSRAVAERCGCSHTTVNNALTRFREYLTDVRDD